MNRYEDKTERSGVSVFTHTSESDAYDCIREHRSTYLSTVIHYGEKYGTEEHDLTRDADEFERNWKSDYQEHNTSGM
jgi:hypothetical protein